MAAYTQLTHLFATRLEPGERELDDQELRLIFGLTTITAEIREEIAEDLRAAGIEVVSVEPLRLRKPEPPPAEPAPPPPPPSRRPWLIAVGAVCALIAVAVMLPRGAAPSPVTPKPVATPRTHAPTRDVRPRATPRRRAAQAPAPAQDISAAEIARPRERRAELPCEEGRRLRSECEARTRSRERRGR